MIKGKRAGAKPCRDLALKERDRDLLDDYDTADVLLYIRKLRGEVAYSMEEVKPRVSACIIESLLRKYDRLRASKSAKALAALQKRLMDSQAEKANLRRECRRLWKIESEYKLIVGGGRMNQRGQREPRGVAALLGEQ